jgi:hypothetical protein
MKKIIFVIFLILPVLALADKPKTIPADYTVAVHVRASRLLEFCGGSGGCYYEQDLSVTIDGKKYELQSGFKGELLRVGDYKAKIAKDETQHAYEYSRTYEFLFPDGQTRQYSVVGETE